MQPLVRAEVQQLPIAIDTEDLYGVQVGILTQEGWADRVLDAKNLEEVLNAAPGVCPTRRLTGQRPVLPAVKSN